VRYAVFDLLAAIDLWLIAGILVAALISTLVPADFFVDRAWSQGLVGMLVVLAISLPLYVCTTASVPIAASLIAAGMPAGSALVFLMAGPATNVATIGAVYRTLGGAVFGLYLGTVVAMSLGFGLVFDQVLHTAPTLEGPHAHGDGWLGVLSAVVLLALLGLLLWRRRPPRRAADDGAVGDAGALREAGGAQGLVLHVQGMSCQHCVGSVKRSLEALESVTEAVPDLASGRVRISGGEVAVPALVRAVEEAGFTVSGVEKRPGRVDAPGSMH
jgi:copper chaperone CopZ